jgi:predicted DNA-binding protein
MHGMIKSQSARSTGRRKGRPQPSRKPVTAANEAVGPAVARITPRLDRALSRLAKMTGKPKSYHTRRALERYVEDTYDYLIAAKAVRTSRKTYSSDEVKKRLRLSAKA